MFACEYYYDVNGIAVWPKFTINYTDKTQALFKINKSILGEERMVLFPNMICIDDVLTDVQCMKLVKDHGGMSIAVYNENRSIADGMMSVRRIDFICTADYREVRDLFRTVEEMMYWALHTAGLVIRSLKDGLESAEHGGSNTPDYEDSFES